MDSSHLRLLADALHAFAEAHPGARVVFLSFAGSRLHGTHRPTSDVDLTGLFVPSETALLLRRLVCHGVTRLLGRPTGATRPGDGCV